MTCKTHDEDGSGVSIGQRVWVDDGRVEFYGHYQGLVGGIPTVKDEDTGETLAGSIDFIEAA